MNTGQLSSIDKAYELISEFLVPIRGSETVRVVNSFGRVTAEPAHSPIDLPSIDNSAVDGYGITSPDLAGGRPLTIVGSLVAGEPPMSRRLRPGEAVYLATGAPVPREVAAVAMFEHAQRVDSSISIQNPLKSSQNIRRRGEDVGKGMVLVDAGKMVDHRHVAILSAAGIENVIARRRIRVALFSTGNELTVPGATTAPGQVFDANTPMLTALLVRMSMVSLETTALLKDDVNAQVDAFKEASEVDVIVTSGGASGSVTDYLAHAVVNAGGSAETLKLAMRPGKPIVVGRLGRALVVGLPGNPTAAMASFFLFVRPMLLALAGQQLNRPGGFPGVAAERLEVRANRTEFAPGVVRGISSDGHLLVGRLASAGSSRLLPLIEADGLLELTAPRGVLDVGERILFHPFLSPL